MYAVRVVGILLMMLYPDYLILHACVQQLFKESEVLFGEFISNFQTYTSVCLTIFCTRAGVSFKDELYLS